MTYVDQESLLVHLRPLLRYAAIRWLPRHERRHTEDLAQEAWIAVWRALPDLPPLCTEFDDIVAWCMAVARNRMRNFTRDLSAPTHGERNSRLPELSDLGALLAEVEAIEQVESDYHDGRVAQAVSELPDGYRNYVIERFWHGVSTTELQKIMSPSIWPRVKKRLASELQELVS